MNLTKEQIEQLNQASEINKRPKLSIPAGSEVNLMIYDIDFTKSAKERAKAEGRLPELMDGITVKMIITDYVEGSGKDAKKIICLDYSNIDNISFPRDVLMDNGETEFAPIIAMEYLTIQRLTNKFSPFGGYNTPKTEEVTLQLFDASFCRQYGRNEVELLTSILSLSNVTQKTWKAFGIEQEVEKRLPKFPAFRYIDYYYPKSEKDSSGNIKPDAKKQIQMVYTSWDRINNNNELSKVPTEWITMDKADKIFTAITQREELRNPPEAKPPF